MILKFYLLLKFNLAYLLYFPVGATVLYIRRWRKDYKEYKEEIFWRFFE